MTALDTGDSMTRIYSGFRGADFRGEEVNLIRSPDCLNMWRNYKNTASIETRPSLEKLYEITYADRDEKILKIFNFNDKLHVITNFRMYREKENSDKWDEIFVTSEFNPITFSFEYGGVFYFSDANNIYYYDGEECKEITPYIPTTSIARNPGGGGTIHERLNLLDQTKRINTFKGDGESTVYHLDSRNITSVIKVMVDGNEYTKDLYFVDTTAGTVAFNEQDRPSKTEGADNVIITFSKEEDNEGFDFKNPILKCTIAQEFDNRIFVSGNPDYPQRIWHCMLNTPTYFSDLDYYDEGVDATFVKGIVPGNNSLWVFREPSDTNTNIFYHVPTIDEADGKIYPSSHSSISLGCIGKAINFNDDIVFFSRIGMEGISGDITSEQFVAHRSCTVDRKLTANKGYKDMILVEWEGYLLVIMGKDVYLADSRAIFTNENHIEYDWYYWQFEQEIVCALVHEGTLYVGTTDGDICSLTGTDPKRQVHSYWVTPKDKFNAPQKLKTTNKRGCVVEAIGDVSVYAKTEDTDYDLIGTYNDIEDYFVSRIKKKKFKDLQLKFESHTSFSLETATLEVFVGGYIKR